jgi:outer membrane protein OmpA-like peptidoglycan-associated protein
MRLLIFFLAAFSLTQSLAQQVPPLANGYYVVVSTFTRSQNKEASSYSDGLNKKGYHSGYGLEESKGFVYVYLQSFDFNQFAVSLDRMQQARKKEGFTSAWVLKIKDGREVKESVAVTTVVDSSKLASTPNKKEVPSIVTEYIPNPTPKPVIRPQYLGNTPVFFSVIQKSNRKVLNAQVKIIDADSKRTVGTVKANGYFNIPDPKSKTGNLTLTASAFGFKDLDQSMNYKDTERDTLKEEVTLFGNFYMLTFEMERISAGASSTLSGISFFNDAAIMTPGSADQLNAVLELLNERPNMRIRIEGHTNGSGRGDIISMGPSKNYFALAKDRKIEKGSAKELSQARADAIKAWLVDQGISDSRVEAVGIGGGKPLYDSKSNLARKNARVEMTVLE